MASIIGWRVRQPGVCDLRWGSLLQCSLQLPLHGFRFPAWFPVFTACPSSHLCVILTQLYSLIWLCINVTKLSTPMSQSNQFARFSKFYVNFLGATAPLYECVSNTSTYVLVTLLTTLYLGMGGPWAPGLHRIVLYKGYSLGQ